MKGKSLTLVTTTRRFLILSCTRIALFAMGFRTFSSSSMRRSLPINRSAQLVHSFHSTRFDGGTSVSLGRQVATRVATTPRSGLALFSSQSSGEAGLYRNIGKEEMKEILAHYEGGGREGSGTVVIDVRTEPEVQSTGKLSPSVETLPVQVILQRNVFGLDEDDFEEVCGFEKPKPDETIVFSCAAGIRSVYACQAATMAGFSNVVNYMGGANEWFSGR